MALCVIGLVLLAHLALIEWARDSLALIQMLDQEDETVVVELNAGKPAPSGTAPELPAKRIAPMPRPAPRVDEASTAESATPPPAASTPPAATADHAADSANSAANNAANTAAETAVSSSENSPASSPPANPAEPLFTRISFPPSAELSYDALAVQGNRQLSGSGSIVWQHNGQSYAIKGEASALLLTLLSYQSSGLLGSAGILPELYQEKRIGKAGTSTHFVRERKTISFSASTKLYEIQGGEQDRGSVIWQLAGLARGDPEKLAPGLAFDAVIAGSKAADRWSVQVIGKESLALGGSNVQAWHLSLAPAENNYDYQIDLWLSPERDWYPIKIVYANRSGATLALTLSRLSKK